MGPNTTVQQTFNSGAIATGLIQLVSATGHVIDPALATGISIIIVCVWGWIMPHAADKGAAS